MKVYYNAGCPVCRAGIGEMQGRGQVCEMQWKDVHADNALAGEVGAEQEFVRKRLHVVDDAGVLHVGFDAFVALWRVTPGQRWLAAVFSLPGLRHLGRLAYNGFAWALYRWNRAKKHW